MSSTNTNIDSTLPAVVFAKMTADLDTLQIENKDDVKIYVIDPFEVELDLFREAFYTNGSSTLSYYQPPSVPTNPLENAKLKNILFLSSGGGSFTDTSTTPSTTITLPSKKITFNDQINPTPENYIYNSFVIKDINETADITFDNWSFDSQIELSKKLAAFQYIYQFEVILNDKNDGTKKNTNALTWTQLQQTVNTYIYKYYNDLGDTPPLDANGNTSVILSYVASFKVNLDDGDITTPITKTTDTRILIQYKITDWPFEVKAF